MSAPPPPAEVRDAANQILGRSEFQHHESVVQRVLDWINEQLGRISFGSGRGPGFVGNLVALVLIAAAITALVVLVRAWRSPGRRRRPEDDELSIEVEHRRTEAEWRSEAEALEAAGRWAEAMRARYRELVRFLIDGALLPDVPGRTTGEQRADIGGTLPDGAADFDVLTRMFEDVWYGGIETGPAENVAFRERVEAVRVAARAGSADRELVPT